MCVFCNDSPYQKNEYRIFVIRDGMVAEEGDYETLMKLDGLFARLARRQME